MERETPAGAPAQGADAVSRRDARRRAYWRANLRLIAALLCVWALVSYGFGIVGVEALNRFHLGGFPLGFWFAQQGATYTFVALIAIYAIAMDRIDRRYGMQLDDGGEEPGAPEADGERTP